MAQQAAAQRKKQSGIHFVLFSAILFLVILVASSVAFWFSMQQIIRKNKGDELLQLLELERHKMESEVNGDIAIVLKMASSPTIQQHFLDPSDPKSAEIALKDIEGYRKMFSSASIFWVKDADKKFFLDGTDAYTVDPEDPELYWYKKTMYETERYNWNIDYDPHLKVTNIWINVPVRDSVGKSIGILGIGVNLSEFIDAIYRNYSGAATLYFFNELGEITGSKKVEQVAAKEHIDTTFGDGFFASVRSLEPGESHTFITPLGSTAVGTVPALEWYSAAIMPDSIDDYKNHVSAVFLMMLGVMALIVVLFNIFIAIFLQSLHKTMDSLEATSRYKSEFLARMSHEIRTPMNAILGMSELALRERNLDTMCEHVSTIKKSGTNLLTIINDILDFSKNESGKIEIVPVDYLFSSLIDDITNIIKIKVQESGLEFRVDIDSRIPKALFGDEARIHQVLLNLLNNAIKYTTEGFVAFVVKGTTVNTDNVILTIEVADSGRGIKAKDMGKLFTEFVQLDTAGNKGIEGTGLGLAISHNLVVAMGGNISVRSEYGKGSTFTVTLPQEISRRKSFDFERTVSIFNAPSAKVLVVDDVSINCTVAKGLISIYGIQVRTCMSGEEAVEIVQAEEFDLIFMDHMMPGMDGIETTAVIRNLKGARFQNIPIVALTANAISGVEEMFLKNGFNDYLSKPIDIQRLNSILEKWIPAEKRE
jgi:signal transduction histidine kinase/CheY-like chemotaxis protein